MDDKMRLVAQLDPLAPVAAELDCCSDCIQSLRERNSERYDGKKI